MIVTSTDYNQYQSEVVTCGAPLPTSPVGDDNNHPAEYTFFEGLSNVGPFVDVGKETFNSLFQKSEYHIIKRECPYCSDTHKEIYYKRLTMKNTFEPYHYMACQWLKEDNVMGVDFNLFSTLEDALSNENPWAICNYGNPTGKYGAFRDCGPDGSYASSQWVNIPVEGCFASGDGKAAAFFIIDSNPPSSANAPHAISPPPPSPPPPLPSGPHIQLAKPLIFPHNGQGIMVAQVGRLTRNIVIKGSDGCELFNANGQYSNSNKPKCGHFRFFHSNQGAVCGVEFTKMGQYTETGVCIHYLSIMG